MLKIPDMQSHIITWLNEAEKIDATDNGVKRCTRINLKSLAHPYRPLTIRFKAHGKKGQIKKKVIFKFEDNGTPSTSESSEPSDHEENETDKINKFFDRAILSGDESCDCCHDSECTSCTSDSETDKKSKEILEEHVQSIFPINQSDTTPKETLNDTTPKKVLKENDTMKNNDKELCFNLELAVKRRAQKIDEKDTDDPIGSTKEIILDWLRCRGEFVLEREEDKDLINDLNIAARYHFGPRSAANIIEEWVVTTDFEKLESQDVVFLNVAGW